MRCTQLRPSVLRSRWKLWGWLQAGQLWVLLQTYAHSRHASHGIGPASAAQAFTQRLYYQDTFLHTCKAEVLSLGIDNAGNFAIPDKALSTG